VEFTRGSRAIATIDQIDSAYHEAGGDPFVASSILGSSQDMQPPQPCSRCHSPHDHRISRHVVDLVEGAARQSKAGREREADMLIARRSQSEMEQTGQGWRGSKVNAGAGCSGEQAGIGQTMKLELELERHSTNNERETSGGLMWRL
jgi:hypothetical protein